MEEDGWQERRQASLFLSRCHPFDDDTNVCRDKGVYKPTLIGFDYPQAREDGNYIYDSQRFR